MTGLKILENLAAQSDKPLHVLTITPFYPTQGNDARGCFIAEPLPWLERLGIVNTVVAVQPFYYGHVQPNSSAPADWIRYPSFPGGLGLPMTGRFLFSSMVARVRDLHSRQPIDLIHAHSPLPCGHAALLLEKKFKIPSVITVHGLDAFFTNQVNVLVSSWTRHICADVYAASRRVVCISQRVEQEVLKHAKAKTTVVCNAADTEKFAPAEHAADAPTILSVGNLIPIKGHQLLLRAFAAARDRHPRVVCEIIGEGPERSRLQTLASQLGIGDRVHFLGRKSRAEVAEAMSKCTIFALPSRYEGLGCVYLEAMSSAKAVIACNGQGIEEVVRHASNGWLIDPENLPDMEKALTTLLGDADLRSRIGAAARETIQQHYTLAHQAAALNEIYRDVSGEA